MECRAITNIIHRGFLRNQHDAAESIPSSQYRLVKQMFTPLTGKL